LKRAAGLALLVVLALALVAAEVARRWTQPLAIAGEGEMLLVEEGASLQSVAADLQRRGILRHPRLFLLYGRLSGLDHRVHRGEYRLNPGLDMRALLGLLNRGEVVQYLVTLPEGITVAAAIGLLQAREPLAAELRGPRDPRLLALSPRGGNAEGLFFPDTYRFERGHSDWHILSRAHQRMLAVLGEEWRGRAQGLPLESPYEALILASIVERETAVAGERARIAGVFVRRLRAGMRLQTDPTVIYGLGEAFDGNLRRRDLKDRDNPYNTYRHGGLPPTPIALPGRAALHAALHPAEGDALYFVARGDGSHQFSRTLQEHEAAVRRYQLQRGEPLPGDAGGTVKP